MSLPMSDCSDLGARLLYAVVPLALLLFSAFGRAEINDRDCRGFTGPKTRNVCRNLT